MRGSAIKRRYREQAFVQINGIAVPEPIHGFLVDVHVGQLMHVANHGTSAISRFHRHKRVGDTAIPRLVHQVSDFQRGEFHIAMELWSVPNGRDDIASHGA